MNGSKSLLTGLTMLAALAFAGPAAAENVLRFAGMAGGAVTMDPHSSGQMPERAATAQVYEALLDIDSNLAVVPQLALGWQIVDPTHWHFQLRRGVRFQDGTPFTAEDVVFSIERARANASDVWGYVANIAAVEAVDDHTVQITTTAPDPLLWMRLANIAIMSKAWTVTHDAPMPGNLRTGEETYASRHANGTGPFELDEFEPHGRWVMVSNSDWWGIDEYPHNIDRIVHTWKDDAGNLEDLLNGQIDLLQAGGQSNSGLAPIRSDPNLKLVYRPKLLTVFFGFDQRSEQLRSSNVEGANPFKDKRVREAIYRAIDFGPLLHKLMGELFSPAGMIAPPGTNGYAPELDRRVWYDPKAAQRLLVEAGYPDGFSVALDCPNEWGDVQIAECRGAAEQLAAIGIAIRINLLSTAQILSQIEERHDSDFFLEAWYFGLDSEDLLRDFFGTHGQYNMAGYTNARVDELIDKAKGEMVTYARDAYLEEAWRIVTDDLVYLPIRHGVSVFAMRKTLDLPPDPWDVPRFRLARFTASKVN